MWQFEASFCLPFLERKWVEQSMDASSWNLITCWWKQMEYLSLDCMCWYEVRKSWLLKDDRKDIHAKPWVDVSFYNLWMFVGLYRSPQLLPLHILLEQKQWCELWALKKNIGSFPMTASKLLKTCLISPLTLKEFLKTPSPMDPSWQAPPHFWSPCQVFRCADLSWRKHWKVRSHQYTVPKLLLQVDIGGALWILESKKPKENHEDPEFLLNNRIVCFFIFFHVCSLKWSKFSHFWLRTQPRMV